MITLAEHIKSQSGKTLTAWAESFEISRPYLYGILDGTRRPSLDVAVRIQRATNGAVSVGDWPHLAAVASAVNGGCDFPAGDAA